MPTAKNVTVIPATLHMHTEVPKNVSIRKRVAAYARVSTDSDEQLTSYEAQVDYYTEYIKHNPDWDFMGVYTDVGISAVMTKHREGFNQMIKDSLNGKIDLIITKSVSRFARNTVDSLSTVRKLKEKGVEVYFQKENIYTFDSKGELLITIMSSLAQEESRSISENVTWGQRKRFADGKVSIPYGQFLGYRKGSDGLPEIIPDEAETVREIYRMFITGKSTNAIAKQFTMDGIPTPGGKKKWQRATIESILTNEKYKGSALLQKQFTVDFLTKRMKDNAGEVPQYYVEESHPAIINPDEWEAVQIEMSKRKNSVKRHTCNSPFSGKIICGDCGEIFGSKVWHSNSKYRRIIWQCNHKFEGIHKCATPHLYEETIKQHFIQVISKYLSNRDAVIEDLQYVKRSMCDTDFIDSDIEKAEHEMEILSGMIHQCIMQNASAEVTEEEYHKNYADLTERYEKQKDHLNELLGIRQSMEETALTLSGMLFELAELDDLPIEFNETLWNATIDHVTVHDDERIVFTIKDGTEITTML